MSTERKGQKPHFLIDFKFYDMAAEYKNKKRDLSVTDRLALCGVAVMGKDYALEAYKMSHNVKTEKPASLRAMVSTWLNNNKSKEFLNEIKQLYADTLLANADEGEELSERQLTRIIERGIVSEKDAKKQADMSLKLMAWRKDAQKEETEMEARTFFIPYVSNCKVCKIMGIFRELRDRNEIDDKTFNAIANKRIDKELKASRQRQAEARARIKAGTPKTGDDKRADELAELFKNLLNWEDVLDIYDYFSRLQKGCSDSVPHWKK